MRRWRFPALEQRYQFVFVFIEKLILSVLTLAALIVAAYLVILTLAAMTRRVRTSSRLPSPRRYAILVPAHNEEKLLPRLLDSIRECDYPKDRIVVWVVADNCSDNTAAIASASGASVFERRNEIDRGKGYALDELLQVVETRDRPDVYVYLDADSTISRGFMRALDAAFDAGAQAVQAHYLVADENASWGTKIRSAAMLLINFVRPLGRSRLGWSAGIKGTGMGFVRDIAVGQKWGGSLAEDAEYHARILLTGVKVDFVPEAKVWAQMPETLAASTDQHRRWEEGRRVAARQFAPRLAWEGLTKGNLSLLDAAFDLLTPPLSVFAALIVVCFVADLFVGGFTLAMAVVAALGLVLHIVVGLRIAGATPEQYMALARAPVLIFWKVQLYLKLLFSKGPDRWIRTRRD